MSVLRKKAKRPTKESRTDNLIGADITIDDFANTLRIHSRFKKSVTNVSNEVKQEATKQEEKPAWDETDEESSLINSTKKRRNRNRRKLKCQEDNDEDDGINYPLDIWFIISEYIRPEAVGKFARICKSSYYVTTTGKFWFYLYKSYYKFVPNLPERLQPQCMRLHGLRACVIRALHYNHFRTSERKGEDMSYLRQGELRSLVKRKCTLMWHKLKEISKTRNNPLKQSKEYDGKKTEFLDTLEDVAVNPEDGCKVLRVSCFKYSMLPPVIGLVLQTISMINKGLGESLLQLEFGSSDIPSTLTNQIVLRHVMGYSILNWWDSAYPHQDVDYMIELQSDSWD